MQQRIIERVHIDSNGSLISTGLPPGFRFEVTPKRLFVVSPMNPEWSETTKLPEGLRIEVFAPSGDLASEPPLAVLPAGSPSAVTFHKRVAPGTPTVQYLVAVRKDTGGLPIYLSPAEVVEIESSSARYANVTFADQNERVNLHFDVVR